MVDINERVHLHEKTKLITAKSDSGADRCVADVLDDSQDDVFTTVVDATPASLLVCVVS